MGKYAVTGSGQVGQVLADGLLEHGHEVMRASREPSKLAEWQRKAPAARFVKAFSCMGNAFMIHPNFPGGPPSMFICGNDGAAKASVRILLTELGWETVDMGAVEPARAIEPLCMLWCIPALTKNRWAHAFKLLHLP
jgi:predicted dinucleotide-binding enzyme